MSKTNVMTNIEDAEKILGQFLKSGDLESALGIVESMDMTSLTNVDILLFAAMLFRRLNDPEKAAELSAKATSLRPDVHALAIAYSKDLMLLGQLDRAETVLDGIPLQSPRNNAHILLQRGKILYQRKDFKAATKLLVNVVKKYPEFEAAHMELAHALLLHGKWKAGWIEYEWRFSLPHTRNMYPKFKMPRWDGSEKLPHILLIADQGYGDCFQYSRYFPLVAQRCQRVTLIRSEPLIRLFDPLPWITSSYKEWKDTPLTSAYCTLSGLPRLFSTRPDTIPDCSGILKADKKDVLRWEKRFEKADKEPVLRVGIAWSGRMEFETNYLRAVPFEKIELLLDIAGVEFFSLQVGETASQVEGKNITDLSQDLKDFAETAAAMGALDLVISTDTSIAHLAGALGLPTWTLLSYAPDWRWGSEGSTSPWYPTMRVFRQDKTRNWQTVIDECKAMLLEVLNADAPAERLLNLTEQKDTNHDSPYI